VFLYIDDLKVELDLSPALRSPAITTGMGNKREEIQIYPNPSANGFVNVITNSSSPVSVKIFNLTGSLCYETIGNDEITISTSGLSAGMYLVQVKDKTFKLQVR